MLVCPAHKSVLLKNVAQCGEMDVQLSFVNLGNPVKRNRRFVSSVGLPLYETFVFHMRNSSKSVSVLENPIQYSR